MNAKLPNKRLARLTGHSGPIHALTYSSGAGQYLLSGSSDRTINLYNPAKDPASALIQSYTGAHGYDVLSIAVAEDNSRFVSGGGDKLVFLWDVAAAKTIRRYGGGAGGHVGRIECVALGGEGDSVLVSASYDSSVRLWDTKSQSFRPLMVLSEAKDSVSAVLAVGHEIFTGSVDGRLRAYDLRMGMVHEDVIGPPITSVTSSQQADSLLVSTLDSTLRLMDKANGKMLQSYTHAGYVNKTYRTRSTLSAYDGMAVAGSEDGSVYAWDVLTGSLIDRVSHADEQSDTAVRGNRRLVSAIACKKRAHEWASAGGDGTIVVWGASSSSSPGKLP